MVRRIAVGVFAAVILALVLGGIFLREPAGPAPDVKLSIITPHWEGIKVEFARAFRDYYKKRTDLVAEIEWLDMGGTSDASRYVQSEFKRSPSGIGVDIFFGGGVATFLKFCENDYLEPYRPPSYILRHVPKDLAGIPVYDEQLRWFGTCFSGFGIVYNKEIGRRMKLPGVAVWEDMANPNLRGWVVSGDPRSSGSVHMMYEIILQAYGFEKGYGVICRMAGNVKAFNEGGSSVPRDVGLAEAYCGPSIDFYAWEQVVRHGEENIGYAVPSGGGGEGEPKGLTVITADPIGIFKGAPNLSAAKSFVDFVLSEEGQKLWYYKSGVEGGPHRFALNRMPVRQSLYSEDAPTGVRYNPFDWKGGFIYRPEKASRRWVIVNDLFKSTIYDVHDELRAAWAALHGSAMPPEAVKVFEGSPASEEEIEDLASGSAWKNAKVRNETMASWHKKARGKFRRVVELCGPGGGR